MGDDLTTVKARMRQAAEHASAAGLKVTPSVSDPRSIETPTHRMGPVTGAEAADYAKKVAAYNESINMAVEARGLEKSAHATLKQSLAGLKMLVDDAEKQWGWLVANTVNGYVGTAVSRAEKWKPIAEAAKQKAAVAEKAADAAKATGDPFWESKTAHELKVAGADADDAARTFASNAKLVGGHTDNVLAKAASANFGDLATDGSKLSKFAEKVPYVGTGLALGQMGYNVYNDRHEGAGTIAKDIGRDGGGFMAGTAATELILASSAGGPATMGAVAVGVGVAYGVGEVVDHWDGISHGVGTAAKWVGNLF